MQAVHRFEEFQEVVGKPLVVPVVGEVFPFAFEPPCRKDIIEQARREPHARIATGKRGDTLLEGLQDYREEFRSLPLDEAVHAPVHLTLFDLGSLAQPGGALYAIIQEVYLPLMQRWAEAGLCWKRAFPILFLSGPGCSTNYHWDPDDVFFIMLSGHKTFRSLKEPHRWLTAEMLAAYQENPADLSNRVRPSGLQDSDIRSVECTPGTALWNPKHAPHWVDADSEAAFSLSIAFSDVAFEPSSARTMEIW
jgi:hypothetical protein